jgi:hypothetical protein
METFTTLRAAHAARGYQQLSTLFAPFVPALSTDSVPQVESFCRAFGTAWIA